MLSWMQCRVRFVKLFMFDDTESHPIICKDI